MFASKTSHESNVKPAYHINMAVEGFHDTMYKKDPATLLHEMEAWTVDGTQGAARAARKKNGDFKTAVSEAIGKNLRECYFILSLDYTSRLHSQRQGYRN